MTRYEVNKIILRDLEKYFEQNQGERFFQGLANLFGFRYLGIADSPDGKNFRDLWYEELEQDKKDFPNIARDIQAAIDYLGGQMTPEQRKHCEENIEYFNRKYATKYEAGQKAHGGDMWEMGAYQVLENMEEEVLDQWSYVRQIRKVLDEISHWTERKYDGNLTKIPAEDTIDKLTYTSLVRHHSRGLGALLLAT